MSDEQLDPEIKAQLRKTLSQMVTAIDQHKAHLDEGQFGCLQMLIHAKENPEANINDPLVRKYFIECTLVALADSFERTTEDALSL